MINTIFTSTKNLLVNILPMFKYTKKIHVKNTDIKDNIIFQPNHLHTSLPVECGMKNNLTAKSECHAVVFQCDNLTKMQLEKMCRFFEIDQDTALRRALWLLNVVKEVEVNNKKIGIISTDNNIVVDITPINIV